MSTLQIPATPFSLIFQVWVHLWRGMEQPVGFNSQYIWDLSRTSVFPSDANFLAYTMTIFIASQGIIIFILLVPLSKQVSLTSHGCVCVCVCVCVTVCRWGRRMSSSGETSNPTPAVFSWRNVQSCPQWVTPGREGEGEGEVKAYWLCISMTLGNSS